MDKAHTGAENVLPYDNERNKGEQVKEMFDNIAPAYDFMNRLMTLGIDRSWRVRAVKAIAAHRASRCTGSAPYRILDVAAGTGDLSIQMARAIDGSVVTGVDLSEGMLAIGRKKSEEAGLADRVSFEAGDCLALPYDDNTFDCVSVAFGVRNFECLADGYREMLRVLKPGGLLCVLELSVPPSPVIRPFYRLYTRWVIPVVGRLASKDVSAYTYLPASIEAVPQRRDMTGMIGQCGFRNAEFKSLTLGVCTLYTAVK